MRNPKVATRLPRSIQKASQSRKQMGRYFPLQNLRDKVIAASIVRAIKIFRAKNIVVSFQNSVKYDKVPKPAMITTVPKDSRNRTAPLNLIN
jgi:hypothetical protein